jgi:hypothetical protein
MREASLVIDYGEGTLAAQDLAGAREYRTRDSGYGSAGSYETGYLDEG